MTRTAGLRQALELAGTLVVGYKFRPRPLNAMFEQTQQLAMDLASEMLPQISTVTPNPTLPPNLTPTLSVTLTLNLTLTLTLA